MSTATTAREVTAITRFSMIFASCLVLGACQTLPNAAATSSTIAPPLIVTGDLTALTYHAVDRLLEDAPSLTNGMPLAVATIADVQEIDTSTPLGNMLADIARSRLVQRGMTVHELRFRSEMLIDKNEGELVLGRDRLVLAPPPPTAAILTGTYAVGSDRVYVSLKIVSAKDAVIVSAADFVLLSGSSGLARLSDRAGLLHRRDVSRTNAAPADQ